MRPTHLSGFLAQAGNLLRDATPRRLLRGLVRCLITAISVTRSHARTFELITLTNINAQERNMIVVIMCHDNHPELIVLDKEHDMRGQTLEAARSQSTEKTSRKRSENPKSACIHDKSGNEEENEKLSRNCVEGDRLSYHQIHQAAQIPIPTKLIQAFNQQTGCTQENNHPTAQTPVTQALTNSSHTNFHRNIAFHCSCTNPPRNKPSQTLRVKPRLCNSNDFNITDLNCSHEQENPCKQP